MLQAQIGIIGGSGFYKLLAGGQEVTIDTPYGQPSEKVLVSEYAGKKIAFLPRHGRHHQYPPHQINYRANLYAFKELGVRTIIAPCAAGSLKPDIKPGDFVICDQFIDRTKSRKDTFFDGPKVVHISAAEPYCPFLRELASETCSALGLSFQRQGTVVVIEGPRFSNKAESDFYSQTADVINMTQYPEVVLARELEICYLNISLVTDYDAGLKGREDVKSVSAQEVLAIFKENNEKLKELILGLVKNIPNEGRTCACGQALQDAAL